MTQAHKMKKLLLYCYFSILFSFISCKENASSTSQSYLAIGDNYTIGESIPESQSWPIQLIKLLSEKILISHHQELLQKQDGLPTN